MGTRNNRQLLQAIFSLILFLEQWSCIGVVWILPTTEGFQCPSRAAHRLPTGSRVPQPIVAGHSVRQVAVRVDDWHVQFQNSSDSNPVETKLWSYVFNLQRSRKSGDMKSARSLAHYLQTNRLSINATTATTLVEVLERALTQAFRLCGEGGDYRLILQLVDGAVQFAQSNPVLRPRIFGEALDALSQTHANISKIKQVWTLASNGGTPFLSGPLTAYELNVMLKSLAGRGKVGACVELYRLHTDPSVAQQSLLPYIRPDAYTASILFSLLTDSIHAGQELETPRNFEASGVVVPEASLLEVSLRKLSHSPCWQWNAVIEILSTLREESQWNNHAYSALIKLQDRAQELIPGHENGARIVMAVFDSLLSQGISPDVVTCTLAIKAMGDPHSDPSSWKLAVHFLEQLKSDSRLPDPNEYSYSAAIVACARCHEYTMALELLQEMRNGISHESNSLFVPPKPNTWVYNAALSAIASLEDKGNGGQSLESESSNNRQELALRLLDQMKYDNEHFGMNTLPDTVTYNTILAIRSSTSAANDPSDQITSQLIDQMKQEGIARDAITYRNAIVASKDASTIIHFLEMGSEDIGGIFSKPHKSGGTGTKGPHDLSYVYNAALSTVPLQSNFKRFKQGLQLMQTNNVGANSETLIHLINALGQNGMSKTILDLLAMLHDTFDESEGKTRHIHLTEGVELSFSDWSTARLDTSHYLAAIKSCLLRNKLEDARAILSLMRDHGIPPTSECLQNFAFAYAQAAIRAFPTKTSLAHQNQDTKSVAASRAQSAFTIAMTLQELSPTILAKVAQACAKTAQWQNARAVLRHLHSNLLSRDTPLRRREVDLVRGLHSTLIRECARQRNVTAALSCANDIQNFASLVRTGWGEEKRGRKGKQSEESIMTSLRELQASSPSSFVGMRSEDWVSLIKSASSAGHWKVCVNTLQFLRAHVQRTNPNTRRDVPAASLAMQYDQLVPALVSTCICLEKRSQYAWGERVLDEWMTWSGRRPQPEAVLATMRSLANRGQGEEVKNLLSRCINSANSADTKQQKGVGYEEFLHIGTITTLHNNGMYDDADEIFISGINQGYLPFVFGKQEESNVYVLDLHGLNVAMAHSAVRVALRRLASEKEKSSSHGRGNDIMIITGRGRNSALRLRPVLRPEVQRMLLEEFYPPLNTVSVPGNTGALMVYDEDISAWQAHQQEQKGARMLALAALLKNASTDRIKIIASRLGAAGKQ